jgi:Protein of unknown function (DUF1641)
MDLAPTREPVNAVLERLNDPAVAAAVVTLLDNADLLSTLVLGLAGFLERGDTIIDSVAASVSELKSTTLTNGSKFTVPTPAELAGLTAAMAKATPVITEVLHSEMVNSETVELLSMFSAAAAEGADRARETGATVIGVRGALKLFRDPEVARGLGFIAEIAKALGRRVAV